MANINLFTPQHVLGVEVLIVNDSQVNLHKLFPLDVVYKIPAKFSGIESEQCLWLT